MAETNIEWTGTPLPDGTVLPGYTFNPWIGCTEDTEDDGTESPECRGCYAREGQNHRVSKAKGLPLWGPTAHRQVTSVSYWRQPLRWNREAQESGIRRKVFCASLADVFEEFNGELTGDTRCWGSLDDVREVLWQLVDETPSLDWLLLTKRPQNVLGMVPGEWLHSRGCQVHQQGGCGGTCRVWPDHVWIGTTSGTRKGFDRRVQHLRPIPAPVRFLSLEPLLEDLHLQPADLHQIDWAIAGGESEKTSGPRARPLHPAAARNVRDACAAAGVPFFFKQWGEWVSLSEVEGPGEHFYFPDGAGVRRVGKKRAGRLLDGAEHSAYPVPR